MNAYRQPDFTNILKILKREKPLRPTLFEFFLNTPLFERLLGKDAPHEEYSLEFLKFFIEGFHTTGYDYATIGACDMRFPSGKRNLKQTLSMNDGFVITDEESFENYIWPEPENHDYSKLERIKDYLPGGMKLMISGPDGIIENAIELLGYENLCYMIYENPELVQQVFDHVGSALLKYYQIAAQYDTVGVIMVNDDWGFNSQTFLPPQQMRKYVFPWHKKIVEIAHKNGKPAILHSCGNLVEIFDDIINDMKFDGKHSYEDNIFPVEQSYRKYSDRIAVLGGIDMNFLVTSTPKQIKSRCCDMLSLAEEHGAYALGSGNSIPTYVPYENYKAMTNCVLE